MGELNIFVYVCFFSLVISRGSFELMPFLVLNLVLLPWKRFRVSPVRGIECGFGSAAWTARVHLWLSYRVASIFGIFEGGWAEPL